MRIFILLATIIFANSAFGWSQTGHRASGEVGQYFLSHEAELAVAEILGKEGLARASTWPDFMRADQSDFWQEEAGYWHYVTVPLGQIYAEAGAPPEGDAYTALLMFSETVLSDEASQDEKALALRFIIHIIGDLHQPMHVGNGEDRGGNDFEISYFGDSTNLHRLWDGQMIDRWNLSYSELAEWLIDDITPELFTEWNNPDPMVWMAESAQLRDRIYPEDRGLSWDYGFQWKASIELRLAQAGVRKAAYLNQLFAQSSPAQAE